MLGHEGCNYQKRLYEDLWWRYSLSLVATVVAATTYIAEKYDQHRITSLPEILRRSNLSINA